MKYVVGHDYKVTLYSGDDSVKYPPATLERADSRPNGLSLVFVYHKVKSVTINTGRDRFDIENV